MSNDPMAVLGVANCHFIRKQPREDLWKSKQALENKLGRALTDDEQTALNLLLWGIAGDYCLEDMGR